jgi:acetyl esterase
MQARRILFTIVISGMILMTNSAMGQMSANPANVGERIRALGNQLTPDVIRITREVYAPLLQEAPKNGVRVTKDEKYGEDERHRLDVYQPEAKASGSSPILIFLHGGGFVRGDKEDVSNVGIYFARHGILTLTPNYRFAPKNRWPSGAEDIGGVINWIRRNGDKFGGNINRIFLGGTSAGAAHAASYVFFEDLQVKGGDGIAGAIFFSGPTFDTSRLDPKVDGVYYGDDGSKYPAMSAINHLGGRKIPVFIVVAELDMPSIHYQNRVLIDALYERDKALPTTKVVMGHNHISVVSHLNTRDESIGPDILEFMEIRSTGGR